MTKQRCFLPDVLPPAKKSDQVDEVYAVGILAKLPGDSAACSIQCRKNKEPVPAD